MPREQETQVEGYTLASIRSIVNVENWEVRKLLIDDRLKIQLSKKLDKDFESMKSIKYWTI